MPSPQSQGVSSTKSRRKPKISLKKSRDYGLSRRSRTLGPRNEITIKLNRSIKNIKHFINKRRDFMYNRRQEKYIYNYRAGFDDVNYPIVNVNYESRKDHQNEYRELFSRLQTLYTKVNATGRNWQFVCIIIWKKNGKYLFVPYKPFYKNLVEASNTTNYLKNEDYNALHPSINFHIRKVIHNANLGGYLKDCLDNGEFINISLDYYVGRGLAQAGWHIDTRRGNSLYTCLTYDNSTDILGPELAYYEDHCDTSKSSTVFRPVIHFPYGSAGFNDNVVVHSTPYTRTAEEGAKLFNTQQLASILPSVELMNSIRETAKYTNIPLEDLAIYNSIPDKLDPNTNNLIVVGKDQYGRDIKDFGPSTVQARGLPLLRPSVRRSTNVVENDLGYRNAVSGEITRPSFIRCHITAHPNLEQIESIFGPGPNLRGTYLSNNQYFSPSEIGNNDDIFKPGSQNNINKEAAPTNELLGYEINAIFNHACKVKENKGGH